MERVVNEASIRPGVAGEVAIVGEVVVEVAESATGPTGEHGVEGQVKFRESVVFTELQRRRAEIAYVKTAAGYEVDFLARYPEGNEELIRVCTSIDDPETREREVRALQDAATEHPKALQVILTMESRLPFPEVPKPIRVMPAWSWMLQGSVS